MNIKEYRDFFAPTLFGFKSYLNFYELLKLAYEGYYGGQKLINSPSRNIAGKEFQVVSVEKGDWNTKVVIQDLETGNYLMLTGDEESWNDGENCEGTRLLDLTLVRPVEKLVVVYEEQNE